MFWGLYILNKNDVFIFFKVHIYFLNNKDNFINEGI